MVPTSLTLLSHAFPDAQARARAIGVWGGVAGIGAATGPVLGGFLVSALTWRSVFLVNVPVGALAFLLTWRFVTAIPQQPRRGLDLAAQITGIVALATLTLALIEGGSWGWSSLPIFASLAIFVLTTLAFIIIERRVSEPMLPPALFSIPTFSAANTVGLLLNFGFYGQLFCISLFFQQIRGFSPFIAGLALLPEAGVVPLSSWLSGRVTGRTGPRLPMIIGLILGSAGFFALALVDARTNYTLIAIILIAAGFGMSFTMPAMTAAVIGSAPRERSGIAAALLNAGRQVGSVLGVALLGSLVSKESTFVSGLHIALLISGAAFLLSYVLTLLAVHRGHQA
jgi:DHA2 family methylenomycin A resistance protein-like MFS transporter